MSSAPTESLWEELYPDGTCSPSDLVKSVLDRRISCLPEKAVPDHDVRYPVDEPSMRAFLETFFTRHLFQLQRSLASYVSSSAFQQATQFGRLRMLDIGSGAAVASVAIMDLMQRMRRNTGYVPWVCPRTIRMTHVLNDTSAICLKTGKQILAAWREYTGGNGSPIQDDQVFTLSTAFPDSIRLIDQLASFLGGYDLVILSYVANPLVDDYGLKRLVAAITHLERLCTPHGHILIVQDKFREALIRRLARMLDAEYQEQTVTQEIYPPRGNNETYTYTYYDCLYPARKGLGIQRSLVA
jgi:ribosomal protein RSM22 (predicted rRNA methylase)